MGKGKESEKEEGVKLLWNMWIFSEGGKNGLVPPSMQYIDYFIIC